MRTPEEVLQLYQDLKILYSERDARYQANMYAYLGQYDKLMQTSVAPPGTDVRRRREYEVQRWNLIKPMVDAHRVLLDRLPLVRVPPPDPANSMAVAFAEKLERAIYALWDASRMKRQHSIAAHNVALYYSTVWFVRWDPKLDHPVIEARKPGQCYPLVANNNQDIEAAVFAWSEDANQLKRRYPQLADALADSKGQVDILEYIDADQYSIIVAGRAPRVVHNGIHELGFCPIVVTPGAWVPEGSSVLFPPGPVDQLVEINCNYNVMQTKWMLAIERNLFPGIYVYGEHAQDTVINNGPGAVSYGEGDTRIVPMPTPSIPPELFVFLREAQSFMRMSGNFPEVASGNVDASIITGKAIRDLQNTMTGLAAESLDSMGDGLSVCTEYMLRMLEAYRPRKKYRLYSHHTFSTRSPSRPTKFGVEIVPAEDINQYYQVECVYSPLGSDFATAAALLMKLKEQGIVSSRWIMDQIPGVEDTETMRQEIENEMRRRLELEAEMQIMVQQKIQEGQMRLEQARMQMQQQAQAGQSVGPGGEAITPQQLGNTLVMPGGRPSIMTMGEPATGSEGFPMKYTALKPFNQAMESLFPEAGEKTGLGPEAVTLEEVIVAIRSVKKIKGKVWAGGQLAERGYTLSTVDLYITNGLDKATIVNGTRNTRLYGRLAFYVVDEAPEGAVLITGGGENAELATLAAEAERGRVRAPGPANERETAGVGPAAGAPGPGPAQPAEIPGAGRPVPRG